jgi:hypothetical protein
MSCRSTSVGPWRSSSGGLSHVRRAGTPRRATTFSPSSRRRGRRSTDHLLTRGAAVRAGPPSPFLLGARWGLDGPFPPRPSPPSHLDKERPPGAMPRGPAIGGKLPYVAPPGMPVSKRVGLYHNPATSGGRRAHLGRAGPPGWGASPPGEPLGARRRQAVSPTRPPTGSRPRGRRRGPRAGQAHLDDRSRLSRARGNA